MKTRILQIAAIAVLASQSGCISLYRAQLERKIPRIDAEYIKVKGHTIYGVSGELVETGVEWKGNTKTINSQSSRIDSPLGSVELEVRKGKLHQ